MSLEHRFSFGTDRRSYLDRSPPNLQACHPTLFLHHCECTTAITSTDIRPKPEKHHQFPSKVSLFLINNFTIKAGQEVYSHSCPEVRQTHLIHLPFSFKLRGTHVPGLLPQPIPGGNPVLNPPPPPLPVNPLFQFVNPLHRMGDHHHAFVQFFDTRRGLFAADGQFGVAQLLNFAFSLPSSFDIFVELFHTGLQLLFEFYVFGRTTSSNCFFSGSFASSSNSPPRAPSGREF